MRIAIFAGPHGSGKTALLLHTLTHMRQAGFKAGVFKIDPFESSDKEAFRSRGFASKCHVAGDVCPDHEAMVVLAEAYQWALDQELNVLAVESGGLCHRCSPFLKRTLAVCVVNGLSNLSTPDKMRTVVEDADVVALMRAEMISPAERQVFLSRLKAINPRARVLHANGLTGEGTHLVANAILDRQDIRLLDVEFLRAVLPTGYCHYCQGIGSGHA